MDPVRHDELHRLAAQAIASQRSLTACYRMRRDLLSHVTRTGLDQYLRTQPDDAFAEHTLAGAQDLLLRIEDEVRLNDGLPEIERDATGTAHMTGGTQVSQRIQVLADHLRAVLEPAWKVHDRLLAEATVSAQRKRLTQTPDDNKASPRL